MIPTPIFRVVTAFMFTVQMQYFFWKAEDLGNKFKVTVEEVIKLGFGSQ